MKKSQCHSTPPEKMWGNVFQMVGMADEAAEIYLWRWNELFQNETKNVGVQIRVSASEQGMLNIGMLKGQCALRAASIARAVALHVYFLILT